MKVTYYLYNDAFFPSFKPDVKVCIRGSTPSLGNWTKDVAVMEQTKEGHWTCEVEIEENCFEYKYVIVREEPFPEVWENGSNRCIQVEEGVEMKQLVIHNRWKMRENTLYVTNVTSSKDAVNLYFVSTMPSKFKCARVLLLGTMLSWDVKELPAKNLDRMGDSDTWLYTYSVESGKTVNEHYKFMIIDETCGLMLWELHDTDHHIDFIAGAQTAIIFDHSTLVVE